jgi:hypothetical protein
MLQTTSNLTYLWNTYVFLQAIIIFVLALSIIRLIGVQPRLAVIPGTLVVIIPDICHLIVVTLTVCCCMAMIFVILIGPNNKQVSSFSEALLFQATALVNGNELNVFEGIYSGQYGQFELAVINMTHVFMIITLLTLKAIILTIIITPFSLFVLRGRGYPSMAEDIESLIYWRYQQVRRTSWLNSYIVEKTAAALRKNKGSRFARLKRFLTKQASRRLSPLLSIHTSNPDVDRSR